MDAERHLEFIDQAMSDVAERDPTLAPLIRRIRQRGEYRRDDESDDAYELRIHAMADAMALGITSNRAPQGDLSPQGYASDRPTTPTLDEDLYFIRLVLESFRTGA